MIRKVLWWCLQGKDERCFCLPGGRLPLPEKGFGCIDLPSTWLAVLAVSSEAFSSDLAKSGLVAGLVAGLVLDGAADGNTLGGSAHDLLSVDQRILWQGVIGVLGTEVDLHGGQIVGGGETLWALELAVARSTSELAVLEASVTATCVLAGGLLLLAEFLGTVLAGSGLALDFWGHLDQSFVLSVVNLKRCTNGVFEKYI